MNCSRAETSLAVDSKGFLTGGVPHYEVAAHPNLDPGVSRHPPISPNAAPRKDASSLPPLVYVELPADEPAKVPELGIGHGQPPDALRVLPVEGVHRADSGVELTVEVPDEVDADVPRGVVENDLRAGGRLQGHGELADVGVANL